MISKGDESTINERQRSVEEVGIVDGIRGGAWLICNDDLQGPYLVIHWASLLEGAERAYKADPNKNNLVVQLTVQKGLKSVRVYHRRTPKDVIIYLKDLANRFNAQATSTTMLEVLRQIPNIESSWQRRKELMCWTVASVGQSNLEGNKLAFLETMYPKRWRSHRNDEQTVQFWKVSNSTIVGDGSQGASTTFWDKFSEWAQKHVDFTHHQMLHIGEVIASSLYVLKSLKDKFLPEVLTVLELTLPICHTIAKTPSTPEGLSTVSTWCTLQKSIKRNKLVFDF